MSMSDQTNLDVVWISRVLIYIAQLTSFSHRASILTIARSSPLSAEPLLLLLQKIEATIVNIVNVPSAPYQSSWNLLNFEHKVELA
jgi:hypothetical protein